MEESELWYGGNLMEKDFLGSEPGYRDFYPLVFYM